MFVRQNFATDEVYVKGDLTASQAKGLAYCDFQLLKSGEYRAGRSFASLSFAYGLLPKQSPDEIKKKLKKGDPVIVRCCNFASRLYIRPVTLSLGFPGATVGCTVALANAHVEFSDLILDPAHPETKEDLSHPIPGVEIRANFTKGVVEAFTQMIPTQHMINRLTYLGFDPFGEKAIYTCSHWVAPSNPILLQLAARTSHQQLLLF